jgi:hypothetical protein
MKIKLKDSLSLLIDLNGKNTINKKGLLNEKISAISKYKLNKLNKELISEEGEFINFRNELLKKFGTELNGKYVLESFLEDGSVNPKVDDFNKEIISLLNETIEIKNYEFNIEEFNFESESNYALFYELMIIETPTNKVIEN